MKEAKTKVSVRKLKISAVKGLEWRNTEVKNMLDQAYLEVSKLLKEKAILELHMQFNSLDSELQYKVALDPNNEKDPAEIQHVRFTVAGNDEIEKTIVHIQEVRGDSEVIFEAYDKVKLFGKEAI